MRNLLILLILFGCLPAQAAMYKWLDENGEVVYSDEPPFEGAQQLDPPAISTTPPVKYKPKPKPKAAAKPAPAPAVVDYKELRVTSPQNDEAVRNNAGNVAINFVITPALDTVSGHSVKVLVDGVTTKSGLQGTSLTIEHMDRGTHKVQVQIVDAKGKLLKVSPTTTFHLLRHSKLFKPAAP